VSADNSLKLTSSAKCMARGKKLWMKQRGNHGT
jgi:hypothetical protein